MKKYLIMLSTLAFGTAQAQLNLQNISVGNPSFVNQDNGKFTLNESSDFKKMEDRFTYGNLRIYMLRANETLRNEYKSIGNHTSLQEALKGKKIKITELGSGTVNTLEIENISKDTIMILAGEVVTGGKQDRVIGQDVMLKPNSGKVQVSVFCVEHGRWTPQGSGYQFNGTIGVATGQVRRGAVVDKNQGKVWEEVADANKKHKTATASGTYAALQNSDSLNTELDKYMKHFEKLMLEDSNYIGFVAVTGDTIISADLFATNQMFRKQAPQLIKSAAIDAITYGSVVAIAASRVMAFLSEFLQDEEKQETQVMQSGTMLKSNGQKIHLNYYKK
jgi:hypothetical protein